MAKYLVQHRRGTAAQWAATNTLIPEEGEIVIEIDEVNSLHKLKIGDGVHTYADLAYLQAGDEIVTQVLAQAKPRVVTVNLAKTWKLDSDGRYSQKLKLDNITNHSRLDLQPNVDMIAELKKLGIVFVTENNNGVITVYSVGNMPLKSYQMQATIVETECESNGSPIVGIPIGVGTGSHIIDDASDATDKTWSAHKLNEQFNKTEDSAVSGSTVLLTDSVKAPLRYLNLYGKTIQNGTPSLETPASLVSTCNGGNVGVGVYGKNLLDLSKVRGIGSENITINGSSATIAAGSNIYGLTLTDCVPVLEVGKTYTLSVGSVSKNSSWWGFRVKTESEVLADANGKETRTFTVTEPVTGIWFYVGSSYTSEETIIIENIQCELCEEATEFEEFKGAQNLAVATPNGLHGVPVKSGGNYTDASGQQWVGDEIDLARGVRVQRCVKKVLNGRENWALASPHSYFTTGLAGKLQGSDILCDSLPRTSSLSDTTPSWWSANKTNNLLALVGFANIATTADELKVYLAQHPITIIYRLETPIETPLSAEEISTYKELYTNKPNTTITNDCGAYMEFGYYNSNASNVTLDFIEMQSSVREIYNDVSNSLVARIDQCASGIVTDAYGDNIELTDSMKSPIRGVTFYGKTRLSKTPSVSAPASILSTDSYEYLNISNEDGTATQSVGTYVTEGLLGIPVPSEYIGDFNYTDENGQRWVCDEANLFTGYLRRCVGITQFTGNETVMCDNGVFFIDEPNDAQASGVAYKNACVCSHYTGISMSGTGSIKNGEAGAYSGFWFCDSRFTTADDFKSWLMAQHSAGTPVTLIYLLEYPTQHYKQAQIEGNLMSSYYPKTLISNSPFRPKEAIGAGMKVEYQIDTKTYIDKKIAELSSAILNNT